MVLSYIALNRIVEEGGKKNRRIRKKIGKKEKTVLSTGRTIIESQLLEKLASFNIHLT